jgi:hypothetical protein
MKVIRSVIRITLIYVQTLKHGDIMFEHKSKQDIYIYIYIYTCQNARYYRCIGSVSVIVYILALSSNSGFPEFGCPEVALN